VCLPFTAILKELVENVDGAEGAIFLEADGEAVQWFAKGDAELLKLKAAYVALTTNLCRDVSQTANLTTQGTMLIAYEGASFLVNELTNGYMVMLEMQPMANIGQAMHRIKTTTAKLQREL
jgi:predicted regulator of Ras-like GTPase activity (Roadblock/LC7/MglB family)